MATSPTERFSSLLNLSNDLAGAVEGTGQAVVAVNARRRTSSSGIHWQPGVVVTADHTVKRDEEITVTLADGHTVPATLVGRDTSTDLAVLRLQDVDLPAADVGDAAGLKVGHMVLAIARSHEGRLSASLGVVSALGGPWRSWYGGQIDQFIRLDLTLYHGSSGGPLVNAQGQIVGINTSGPRNMALAIPASTVNRVVDQLLSKGHITRGYLGVGMQPVRLQNSLKESLNLTNTGGVIVVSIESGGPSEQAGILIGDVLVAFDGVAVEDTGDVLALLSPERVGKTITVQVVRGGTLTEVAVVVGERPHQEA